MSGSRTESSTSTTRDPTFAMLGSPMGFDCVRKRTPLKMTRVVGLRYHKITVERTMSENKKDPSAKFFERGAGKSFLSRKFSPRKKTQIKPRENPRRGFSLFLCVAKEFTLSCVFIRIIMGLLAPNPRHLLKKVDENFQAWVRCEHWRFNGRAHNVRK